MPWHPGDGPSRSRHDATIPKLSAPGSRKEPRSLPRLASPCATSSASRLPCRGWGPKSGYSLHLLLIRVMLTVSQL